MSKYIDIEISLKKTIKIDNDNIHKALEIAKDNLAELEMTSDWLNSRNVTFKENLLITPSAETIAKLYSEKFNLRDLKEFINMVFNNEVAEHILSETLDILKNKYKIDIENKNYEI